MFTLTALAAIPLAAALSAGLILALKPLLQRYALARPNARSSHRVPTPQGGGIAVVGAALLVCGGAVLLSGQSGSALAVVAAAAVVLAIVGTVDDIRPLPALPRLVIQLAAVAAVVLVTPGRVFPEAVPYGLEAAVLVLAGGWFVNLVNFMDGLDWITVAEFAPLTAALTAFGLAGYLPALPTLLAAGLLGATLGFAPFNRPVARLFLGDVGSLPMGLILGFLLLELARAGALAAALLLPLYYLADTTITLVRRAARRERVWEAHRTHFYQRATDNGFSVLAVDAHVLGLNFVLAGLAAATLAAPHPLVSAGALAAGGLAVGFVLVRFASPRVAGGARPATDRGEPA